MNDICISVIVPIYNVEPYLSRCIESLQSQTLSNIEILLIDDGSTDSSGKIADNYSLKDPRIRVFHKGNEGLSATRNFGLSIAEGKYVLFIDSDDWIDSRMLEFMYQKASVSNSDITVCGVEVEYVKEKRSDILIFEDLEYNADDQNLGDLFLRLEDHKLSNFAWNKLYLLSFLKNNNLQFENLMPAEDFIFNLSAFKYAKRISVLSSPLYHYMRRDSNSILTSYHSNLVKIENRRICDYMDFLRYFHFTEEFKKGKLEKILEASLISLLLNLYHNRSPFLESRNKRVDFIRENIFSHKDMVSFNGNISYRRSFLMNLFLFLLKYSSPWVMESIFSVLFLFRKKFVTLYYKFREHLIR
mgnify:CR=1 FL=1